MAEEGIATWNDFSAGEAGRHGLTKPPGPGFFSGRNVLVYSNGLLGPRPGLKNLRVSNVPSGRTVALEAHTDQFNGVTFFRSIYHTDTPTLRTYLFWLAQGVVSPGDIVAPAGASVQVDASTDAEAKVRPSMRVGSLHYFADAGQLYRVSTTTSGAAPTLLFSGLSPRAIASHGVRVYITQNADLRYSAANDATSWPAANVITVGAASKDIVGLYSSADGLYIVKEDEIWVLTGQDPTSGRLVKLNDGWGVDAPWTMALDRSRRMLGIAGDGKSPIIFDGAQVAVVDHIDAVRSPLRIIPADFLTISPSTAGAAAAGSPHGTGGSTLLVDDKRAHAGATDTILTLFDGRTWTQHTTTLDVHGLIAPWIERERYLLPADGTTNATAPAWYGFDPFIQRPGFVNDAWSAPGDGSDTPVAANASLPEFWTPDGGEVRVRQVIVDFVKWDTGSATANQLDVAVETFGRRGTSAEATETKTWTEAATPSVNLLTANESSFETSVAGWTPRASTDIVQSSTAGVKSGTFAMRMTRSGTAGSVFVDLAAKKAVTAGQTYVAEAWFTPGATPRGSRLIIDWFTSADAFISSTFGGATATLVAGPMQLRLRGTAPATAAKATIVLQVGGLGDGDVGVGELHYVDDVTLFRKLPEAGVRDRAVFEFGTGQPGAGFQVKLPILRGVAIRSVQAVYTSNAGTRPRR